jgi:hypothetical protein
MAPQARTDRSATRSGDTTPTGGVHRTPVILYFAALIPALMAGLAAPALLSTGFSMLRVGAGIVAATVVGIIDLAVLKTLEAPLTPIGRWIAIGFRLALTVALALSTSLAVSLAVYAPDIQTQLAAETVTAAATAAEAVRDTDTIVSELTATATETVAAATQAQATATARRGEANAEATGMNGARGTGEVWTELDRIATAAEAAATQASEAAWAAQVALEAHLAAVGAAADDAAETVLTATTTPGLLAKMASLETLKDTQPGVASTVHRVEALVVGLDLLALGLGVTSLFTPSARRANRREAIADLEQQAEVAAALQHLRDSYPAEYRHTLGVRRTRTVALVAVAALVAGLVVVRPGLPGTFEAPTSPVAPQPILQNAGGDVEEDEPATAAVTVPLIDDGDGIRSGVVAGVEATVPVAAAPDATMLAVDLVSAESLENGGVVDVELLSDRGEAVQIADGQHSLFTFQLATGMPVNTAMQTRPTPDDPWVPVESSYDPTTGLLTVVATHLSQFTTASNPPSKNRPLTRAMCEADVLVGLVRGSGQVGSGQPLHNFTAEIEDYVIGTLGRTFDFFTVDYAAVDIPLIFNYSTLATFKMSVDGGTSGLRGDLQALSNQPACADTAVLIASYSQGSVATHRALSGQSGMTFADNIASVTLFGDAARVASDPVDQYPGGDADNGLYYNLSFALGSAHTSEPWWRDRATSLCHPRDPVCSTHLSFAALASPLVALVEVGAQVIDGKRIHTSGYEDGDYMRTAVANATSRLRGWMNRHPAGPDDVPAGSEPSPGTDGVGTPPTGGEKPGGEKPGGAPVTVPGRTGTVEASWGTRHDNGASTWITAVIRGLNPGQTVTLYCNDDATERFEDRAVTANAAGTATAKNLCFTDRPSAWVTSSSGARSTTLTAPRQESPPPPPPATYTAQQGSRGTDTFQDTRNASGVGPRMAPHQSVQVTCRKNDPNSVVTSNRAKSGGNWWYRLASSPWKNGYWAPSTTFMNGDTAQTPQDQWTDVDNSIRVC